MFLRDFGDLERPRGEAGFYKRIWVIRIYFY